MIKDRVKNGIDENISWANLNYAITPDISVRAGRMGVNFHMLSEYRDVGFAYLWVRPVTEFYSPIAFSYFDGMDIAYTQQLQTGSLQFRAFAGPSAINIIESGVKVHTEADLFGASISFERQHRGVPRQMCLTGKFEKLP